MNARAVTSDVLLGIVPIALVIALWQAIASFGYAPASLLPAPGLVFTRLAQQLGITRLGSGRGGLTMKSEVPFGPFLIASCILLWLMMIYGISLSSIFFFQ